MNNLEFQEQVKNLIEEMRGETLHELLKDNDFYQECTQKLDTAEKAYSDLEFTEDQRKIVNEYISWCDMVDMEYSTFSYIAGIYDSRKYPAILNCNPITPPKYDQILEDLFNGNLSIPENFKAPIKTRKH